MLLCVNVSNSKITLGVFDGDELVLKTSVSASVGKTTTEYAVLFKSVFDLHNFDTARIDGVIIACVVPALTAAVRDALGFIYKGRIFVVGPKLKNGLKIKSENPSQIGASLVCQSVALTEKYPMPCLLISMSIIAFLQIRSSLPVQKAVTSTELRSSRTRCSVRIAVKISRMKHLATSGTRVR